MRRLLKSLVWVTILLSGLLLTVRVLASPGRGTPPAQTTGGTCDELQVIFVVDQSGSMSQELKGGRQPSDPDGLRFFGPAKAVEVLSSLRYHWYQASRVRTALVHFGDKPRTQMPWTDLDATTSAEHEALKRDLSPFFDPVPSLGNTNVLAAFQTASSLFNQAPPQRGNCPIRAVIVLTDGLPALAVDDFDWVEHMEELGKYVDQYMSPPQHSIYVIGIDRENTYWPAVEPYWVRVAGDPGKVRRALDEADMGHEVYAIVEELAGSLKTGDRGGKATMECVEGGKKLPVPPFTQQVQMTLIKPYADLHLEVLDERGQPLEPSRSDVSVTVEGYDEPVETLTVRNPQPGLWDVLTQLPYTDTSRCQIRLLRFDAVGELVSPDDTETPLQYKRLPVLFRVTDTDGNPLPDYRDARYALQVEVNLVGPSAQDQVIILNANPDQEYHGETIPLEPGANELRVEGESRNPDGTPFPVFEQSIATIQVRSVRLAITEHPTEVVEQYVEVPLSFAIVDGGQQPIKLDLPTALSATVTYEGETVSLVLSAGPDHVYSTSYQPQKAGRYEVRYEASVATPRGDVSLGSEAFAFEVFPVKRIGAKILAPQGDSLLARVGLHKLAEGHYVATDPILRPTGLVLHVQMIDEDGNDISPGHVGAANPMSVFRVEMLNEKYEDVSSDLKVTNTGKPGLFQIESSSLGRGQYEVQVMPDTELGRGYTWAEESWSKTVHGEIDPLFYALIVGALILVASGTSAAVAFARARRHPLSGYIEVFQEVPDAQGSYRKTVLKRQLPRWNRIVIRVPRSAPAIGGVVRRFIVSCPTEEDSKAGRARVEARFRSGPNPVAILDPAAPATPLGSGFSIEKGPRSIGAVGPEGASATFDIPGRRR